MQKATPLLNLLVITIVVPMLIFLSHTALVLNAPNSYISLVLVAFITAKTIAIAQELISYYDPESQLKK